MTIEDQLISNRSKLIANARYLTQDESLAEDLYQDTCIRALSYKHLYEEQGKGLGWFNLIMKNLYINEYRKKKRNPISYNELKGSIQSRSGEEIKIDSIKYSTNPEAETELNVEDLMKYVNKLHDDNRIPFLMFCEGYKYEELAKHFNIPLGTVKSRIYFARLELKEMITGQTLNKRKVGRKVKTEEQKKRAIRYTVKIGLKKHRIKNHLLHPYKEKIA